MGHSWLMTSITGITCQRVSFPSSPVRAASIPSLYNSSAGTLHEIQDAGATNVLSVIGSLDEMLGEVPKGRNA